MRISALSIFLILLLSITVVNLRVAETDSSSTLEIGEYTEWQSSTKEIENDLIIRSTGTLVIENVTLRMNADMIAITVEEGGDLIIIDSILTSYKKYSYKINVYGTLIVKRSIIEFANQILIESDNTVIEDCIISDSYPYGIYISQSKPKIKGNFIISNPNVGIYNEHASPSIENNVIFSNRVGIYCDSSSKPVITNSSILSNDMGIASFNLSKFTVSNTTISGNNISIASSQYSALYITDSLVSHSGLCDFLLDNGAEIVAVNTTFDRTNVMFQDNTSSLSVKWYLEIAVLNSTLPLKNVSVNIKDSKGKVLSRITDSEGRVRETLTEYHQNYSTLNYFTPYTIEVFGLTAKTLLMESRAITLDISKDNQIPVADAGDDIEELTYNLIYFDASNSSDVDGSIEEYSWDFGDGSVREEGKTVEHHYDENGVYTVILTVVDNLGAIASDVLNVTIGNRVPEADAGKSRIAHVKERINFDASNSTDLDGFIEEYEWDFGDNSSAVGKRVEHVYNNTGNYTVTLTVRDDDGGESSDSIVMEIINSPPVADAGENRTVHTYELITFDASNSWDIEGDIVSYLWEFGDGNLSDEKIAMHEYIKPGNYTVTLTVKDEYNTTSTDTVIIKVINLQPRISNVTVIPMNITKDDDITIYAEVTDDRGVSGVFVNYTVLESGKYYEREMEPLPGNNYYITLGTFPAGSTIEYHIKAIDTDGEVTVSESKFIEIESKKKVPEPPIESTVVALITVFGLFLMSVIVLRIYKEHISKEGEKEKE